MGFGDRNSGFHLNLTTSCLCDPVWESDLIFMSFFQVIVHFQKMNYVGTMPNTGLVLSLESLSPLFLDR